MASKEFQIAEHLGADITLAVDNSTERPMIKWRMGGQFLANWHLQRITEDGNLWLDDDLRWRTK